MAAEDAEWLSTVMTHLVDIFYNVLKNDSDLRQEAVEMLPDMRVSIVLSSDSGASGCCSSCAVMLPTPYFHTAVSRHICTCAGIGLKCDTVFHHRRHVGSNSPKTFPRHH